MDTKSRKQLIARFGQLAEGLALPFKPFSEKAYYLFPSNYAFVHHASTDIWLFLVVYVNPKGEHNFTLKFGWSIKGRFPEVLDSRFTRDKSANTARYTEDELINRTSVFVGNDHWWPYQLSTPEINDDTFAEVEELLRGHVIPYLRGFLESRGQKK
jgi:hypothetical protein